MDICDACIDLYHILQSFDEENRKENNHLSKKEIVTLLLFIQSWPQRQCGCCFRDIRNFDRVNNLVQLLLRFAIDAVASLSLPEENKKLSKNDNEIDEDCKEEKEEEEEIDESELWTMDEKDKLLHCVSKVFQLNFFLYSAHKQNFHAGMEDISPHEAEALGNYCDMNDMEVPLYLLRNVCFFCDSNGMTAIQACFERSVPETLPFNVAFALISVVANLRIWLHAHATMQYVSPLRSQVIQELLTVALETLTVVLDTVTVTDLGQSVTDIGFRQRGTDGGFRQRVLVRREACDALFRLCLGNSNVSRQFSHSLMSSLLSFLTAAQNYKPPLKQVCDHDEVEENNLGCKNYFRLLSLLVDNVDSEEEDGDPPEQKLQELDNMAKHLAESIRNRDILEQRHNTIEDVALTGLLKLCSAVIQHNPPFKYGKDGQVRI
ncbi:ubiquitin carboxyl-terminal hydrolase 34-like [Saccoglossus kowalevskii]